MKFLKEKKGIIAAFLIGAILASSIAVYATVSASQVDYKDGKSVEYALNDLYEKTKTNKTLTLVQDSFQLDSTHGNTYSKNIDVSSIEEYEKFTANDFYIVINGVRAASTTGTDVTSLVDFTKSYNKDTGILTVTAPYQNFYNVGVWFDISVYLYY